MKHWCLKQILQLVPSKNINIWFCCSNLLLPKIGQNLISPAHWEHYINDASDDYEGVVSRPTTWSFFYIWISLLISEKYSAAMRFTLIRATRGSRPPLDLTRARVSSSCQPTRQNENKDHSEITVHALLIACYLSALEDRRCAVFAKFNVIVCHVQNKVLHHALGLWGHF